MITFADFLSWEVSTRDTLDVKKIYIDMAGELAAGVALSEIIFWHLPNEQGSSKMRVKRDEHQWIAVPRWEWWERCRLTPRQADRVLSVLRQKKLIITERWKWRNTPTVHIRINTNVFLEQWKKILEGPKENPFLPNGEIEGFNQMVKSKTSPDGEMDFTKKGNLKTETTDSETTTDLVSTNVDTLTTPLVAGGENPFDEIDYDTSYDVPNKPLSDHQLMFGELCAVFEYDANALDKSDQKELGGTVAKLRGKGFEPGDIPKHFTFLKEIHGPSLGFDNFTHHALVKYAKDFRAWEAKQKPQPEPGESSDPLFNPIFATMTIHEQFEYNRRASVEAVEKVLKNG